MAITPVLSFSGLGPSVEITRDTVTSVYAMKIDGVTGIDPRQPSLAEIALGVPYRSHQVTKTLMQGDPPAPVEVTQTVVDSTIWPLEVQGSDLGTVIDNALTIFAKLALDSHPRPAGAAGVGDLIAIDGYMARMQNNLRSALGLGG